MALYSFDGTGQNDDNADVEDVRDTNVARFLFAYRPSDGDLPIDDRHNHYQRGVGSAGLFRKALGVITGFGGRTFVRRGLDKLRENITRNDTIIDVAGFSRGAALALDFVNEIAKGKVKLADGRIPTVRFLGLWDCVPSFGVPISPLNIGWDLDLPSNVGHCFHALALDERRGNFHLHRPKVLDPTEPGRLSEVWFRGVHSDIGGSGAKEVPARGLSSISLNWMFINAHANGVEFDPVLVAANKALIQVAATISDNVDPVETHFRELRANDLVHETVAARERCNNPMASCQRVSDTGESRGTFGAPIA